MKLALKAVALVALFSYLLISFLAWELNPGHWLLGIRLSFVFILVALSIIYATIIGHFIAKGFSVFLKSNPDAVKKIIRPGLDSSARSFEGQMSELVDKLKKEVERRRAADRQGAADEKEPEPKSAPTFVDPFRWFDADGGKKQPH